VLSRLSGEFAQRAGALEAEIQEIAGEPLNPGSPKQLGDILFGKLGLPGGTKTKTGQWATGARVLDELAEQGHPLPQKILDWRQVSKLKSTYTDALPGYVNPDTHRVHTSYALAATPTGRLSSSEPNLQNIPIRTEEGRKIRRAFNERASINARLQGTAADIIRRAMVRMEDALAKKKLSAQMLLQVHDELVFEVADDQVDRTLPVVKKVMEEAPMPALSLAVPLAVDAHAANNWEEAH
jgi:DNA polymerase I-like protein with 3'-5' exonuclease and polymerase domains